MTDDYIEIYIANCNDKEELNEIIYQAKSRVELLVEIEEE